MREESSASHFIISFQQLQQTRLLLYKLIHRALFGRLIRSPAKQLCTVAEAMGGHVVEAHFDHELGLERLPSVLLAAIPSARAARSVAGESGRLDQFVQLFG